VGKYPNIEEMDILKMSKTQMLGPSLTGILQDHRKLINILKIRASSRKITFLRKDLYFRIFGQN